MRDHLLHSLSEKSTETLCEKERRPQSGGTATAIFHARHLRDNITSCQLRFFLRPGDVSRRSYQIAGAGKALETTIKNHVRVWTVSALTRD